MSDSPVGNGQAAWNRCPKCGFASPDAGELGESCPACGIVIARYLARLAQEPAQTTAPERDTPSLDGFDPTRAPLGPGGDVSGSETDPQEGAEAGDVELYLRGTALLALLCSLAVALFSLTASDPGRAASAAHGSWLFPSMLAIGLLPAYLAWRWGRELGAGIWLYALVTGGGFLAVYVPGAIVMHASRALRVRRWFGGVAPLLALSAALAVPAAIVRAPDTQVSSDVAVAKPPASETELRLEALRLVMPKVLALTISERGRPPAGCGDVHDWVRPGPFTMRQVHAVRRFGAELCVDEWGRPMRFDDLPEAFEVRSAGRDTRFETGDDFALLVSYEGPARLVIPTGSDAES